MARVPRHYEEFVNDLKDHRTANTALEYALAFRDYRREEQKGPPDETDGGRATGWPERTPDLPGADGSGVGSLRARYQADRQTDSGQGRRNQFNVLRGAMTQDMFATVTAPPDEELAKTLGTLAAARAELASTDGVACPCCGQWVKTYRRVLNSQMAHFIIRLYRHLGKTGNEYALSRDFLDAGHKASSDGTYLRLWNLIRPHRDDRGRTIKGEWGITPEGVAFVDARMTVNQAVYIRAGKVLRFDKDQTDIKEALGRKFDYDELMGRERKTDETA